MAGSRSLGTLTLDLVVKAGAFTAGMTAAERQAAKSLSAIEKRAYAFGRTLGAALKAGAVIATAALTSVAIAVGQAIDRADEMRDLSIQTGIATEKLSAYAYAAKQTGTDIEGLSRGLKILSKNAKEAADGDTGKGKLFAALGVSVLDAEGNLRKLDELLTEIADKFKQLEDGTTKAALAQELFGKSGLELTEFLNQGADGLQRAADKAKALGIIISGETAKAADDFNDKLGDLRAATEGFALQLAAKLLPQLIELVDKVNNFVGNGENATKIANGLAKTMDVLGGAISVASKSTDVVNAAMGTFIGLLASATTIAQGLISLDFSKIGKGLSGGLAALQAGASMALLGGPGGPKQGKTLLSPNRPRFDDVSSRVLGEKTLDERLAELFKGAGGTAKGKKSGAGKSDAVKQAEQLEEACKRMVAQLKEQAAMVGVVSEVEKLRYELNNGELSKLDESKKTELLQLTQIAELRKKDYDALQDAIKLEEEQQELKEKGIEAANQTIKDMEFELSLLGKSNLERAKAIELKNLDVNATEEQRAAVASLTEELIRASENQQFLDDFKEGLADAFVDFASGAKSASEAFGDFIDSVTKRALQFLADKAIEALFDSFNGNNPQSGTGSGGAGGSFDWAALIGSFFGGGKANGGRTMPGMFYRVNENGPEMLSVQGKDYLMMGSKSGVVTPNQRSGGVGRQQVINMTVQGRIERRNEQQIAREIGYKTRVATARG